MPPTPAQIKDKLINALDDEKNVIDEKTVEEVITLLEASVITKEILEQTRLGRDINLVRKNSKNPAIAKRAKSLVKAWQKLIEDPGSPRTVLNGQHPPTRVSPGLSPAPARSLTPGLSPAPARSSTPKACLPSPALLQAKQLQAARLGGTPSAPTTPLAGKPAQGQALATGRPLSKPGRLKQRGKPASPAVRGGLLQKEDSNMSWPVSSPSNISESSQDRLLGDRENQEGRGGGKNSQQPGSSKRNFRFDTKPLDHSMAVTTEKSANRASDQRDVSKTNVANRKRTRSSFLEDSNDSSLPSDTPPSKQTRLVSPSQSLSASHKNDVINGSVVRKPTLKSAGAGDCSSPNTTTAVSSSPSVTKVAANPLDSAEARLQFPPLRQDSADSRASKTGKVKTTEQIIEDMQKKAASTADLNVIAQIRTNIQQKETEAQRAAAAAAAPPEKKKRGRKKKGSAVSQQLELPGSDSVSDTRQLAQAKSEYIKHFLQTSVTPTPGEDHVFEPHNSRQESLEEHHHHVSIALGGCSSSFVQPACEPGFPSYASRQDKPDSGPSASPPEARDIIEGRDGGTSSSLEHLTEKQILARLLPVDPGSIDWSVHDYPAPEPLVPSEETLQQLHHGRLESINGTYDRDGQFRRWHEMLTTDSIYDEPIHILPYVVPD